MKFYQAMPDEETIRRDVLGACFRPLARRDTDRDRGTVTPDAVAHRCDVLLNLVGVLPHIAAGAVYLYPGIASGFTRRPTRIVAVVASVRTVERVRVIDWCEAIVGEIELPAGSKEQTS